MRKNLSGSLFCHSTVSLIALGLSHYLTGAASAQEVRGPESPQATSGSVAAGAPTQAQSANDGGLADIVVTARKVAEKLQDVPIAVTAYSGAELQQQGAVRVSDIAKLTPGLIITPASIGAGAAQFTIRGQVQDNNLATLDPSVGIYVDGVYWARAYGINSNLLDMQDVQTLKGPQGTLFGRNTTGGAILFQTNNPSFNDGIAVLASGTYGRFNEFSGTAVVNVPLVDDKLAVRVAYTREKRDGYIDETTTGKELDARNNFTVRGKLLYRPTSNLSILLSGEEYRSNSYTNPLRVQYLAPGGLGYGQALADIAKGTAGPPETVVANQSGTDTIALNVLPRTYIKTQTYSGTVSLDTFFGALKAIGSYRKIRTSSDVDLDGSPYHIGDLSSNQAISQYSAELQATGKAFNEKLDFAAGLYYFHEQGIDRSYSVSLVARTKSVLSLDGYIRNDSQGAYSQATYHINDKLAFTGGLRYSIDDKRVIINNGVYSNGIYSGPLPGATYACALTTCPQSQSASFSGLSYTAGVDYKLTDGILTYAKTAKSFRGGGQNARGSSFFPGSETPFKPENVTSYELGLKNELFGRKLRVNLAGYYTIDKNIQRTTVQADALGNTATTVANAGRADFYGGELELNALLPYGFRLDGTAAYTHPKYKSFLDAQTGFDRSHERFYGVAKWTASISPSWTHDFDFGVFTLRGDLAYQSKTAIYGYNYYVDAAGVTHDATNGRVLTPTTAAALLAGSTDKAHTLIDGRASFLLLDGKLDLAVWGKNLSNKRDLIAAYPFSSLGSVYAMRREPRTVGVTATIKLKGL
jgi:iron complex outermembrane receptor protein